MELGIALGIYTNSVEFKCFSTLLNNHQIAWTEKAMSRSFYKIFQFTVVPVLHLTINIRSDTDLLTEVVLVSINFVCVHVYLEERASKRTEYWEEEHLWEQQAFKFLIIWGLKIAISFIYTDGKVHVIHVFSHISHLTSPIHPQQMSFPSSCTPPHN